MRITNQMVTNNALNNLSKNQSQMSKLSEQYTTQSLIQRPSDDPVIAVKSLKYRSQLSRIGQYTNKNIPDAKGWMDMTQDTLTNMSGMLTSISTYCSQGANGTMTTTARNDIAKYLKEIKDQIYYEGNTDYAGRYIFSGYRTDRSLTFTEGNSNMKYSINEKFNSSDISSKSVVIPPANAQDMPTTEDVRRIRLAYGSVSDENPSKSTITLTIPGNPPTQRVITPNVVGKAGDAGAYQPADDEVNYIAETGELIIGKGLHATFDTATSIDVNYEKTGFAKGDIRPENYFNCSDITNANADPALDKTIVYTISNQKIEYEVNAGQKIAVNVQGKDVFTPAIGRDIDELIASLQDTIDVEKRQEELKKKIDDPNTPPGDLDGLKRQLEQVDVEVSLKQGNLRKYFEQGKTQFGKHQEKLGEVTSDLGSRYERLELNYNRLKEEELTVSEYMSKNEEADVAEVLIKYSASEFTYNLSLAAASKLLKQTLLDFL